MLIIFCDLKKAFDTCNTQILLKKLEKIGIRNTELDWFASYLNDRKQFVNFNGVCSEILDITIGVPQGSILGPILFLLYINDLPGASEFYSLLFADDTALAISDENLETLMTKAQSQLNKVHEFFKTNKLSLNPDKTKFMIVSHSNATNNFQATLTINGKQLERIKNTSPLPA